jgi:hypothetical protein
MFAEPFLKLLEVPRLLEELKKPVLVKKMDKRPKRARGYHGGEILAQIKESGEDWLITLCFGSLTQRMKRGDDGQPVNVMTYQKFILPKREMESFEQNIDIMLKQTNKFDRLKMNADATPEWTFFNENPGDASE